MPRHDTSSFLIFGTGLGRRLRCSRPALGGINAAEFIRPRPTRGALAASGLRCGAPPVNRKPLQNPRSLAKPESVRNGGILSDGVHPSFQACWLALAPAALF